jgi:enoyl-[acyl-carrier protein] reductase II
MTSPVPSAVVAPTAQPVPLRTRLTDQYNVRHPVAAAGLAFAGMTPDLAVAVCRGGGLGAVGVGLMPPDTLRAVITAIRAATTEAFNINFITTFTPPELVDVCAEERVPVVSWHWGHPDRSFIERLQSAGVRVWEQVGSVDDARRAVDDGIDLVVAQGSEAGGHNYGTLPTFVLLPSVIDAVHSLRSNALVLGAGGISDGRGLAAALALGADGAWIGTRLVATDEAFAHPDYKRRLLEADGCDTVLSSLFGRETPDFNPMRVLRNRVVAEHAGREHEPPRDTSDQPVIGSTVLGTEDITLRKYTFMVPIPPTTGDLEEMPLLAGQAVGLVQDIAPAAMVVERMAAEAAGVLDQLTRR